MKYRPLRRTGLHVSELCLGTMTFAGQGDMWRKREIVPAILDQKVGLMVWSPLAGGLLSGKYTRAASGPGKSRRMSFDFPPVNKERAWRGR